MGGGDGSHKHMGALPSQGALCSLRLQGLHVAHTGALCWRVVALRLMNPTCYGLCVPPWAMSCTLSTAVAPLQVRTMQAAWRAQLEASSQALQEATAERQRSAAQAASGALQVSASSGLCACWVCVLGLEAADSGMAALAT